MLDEMTSYNHDESISPGKESAPRLDARLESVRRAVMEVFHIETEQFHPQPGMSAVFTGKLLIDSEAAYDQLDSRLAPLDHIALFREKDGVQQVQVVPGRFNPAPRSWVPNAILFVLTVLSLLYVGAGIALGDDLAVNPERQLTEFWRGWPYALSIVLILGSHELGHYFAARRHGVPVTLPYFIPLPVGFFGTLGAFIQLRAPMRNRKVLLDVGAAGPLAGLIFALPILFIGLATSEVVQLPNEPYLAEGNSVFYAFAKVLVFGRSLPSGGIDVLINQLATAGWTGLFITGLNLIPIGQLDGGHVLYTLIGERARALYVPAMLIMGALALLVSDAWLLWVLLLLMFGRLYATPLDMITPLDGRRRVVAFLALLIFILVFVPNPLQVVTPAARLPVEMF